MLNSIDYLVIIYAFVTRCLKRTQHSDPTRTYQSAETNINIFEKLSFDGDTITGGEDNVLEQFARFLVSCYDIVSNKPSLKLTPNDIVSKRTRIIFNMDGISVEEPCKTMDDVAHRICKIFNFVTSREITLKQMDRILKTFYIMAVIGGFHIIGNESTSIKPLQNFLDLFADSMCNDAPDNACVRLSRVNLTSDELNEYPTIIYNVEKMSQYTYIPEFIFEGHESLFVTCENPILNECVHECVTKDTRPHPLFNRGSLAKLKLCKLNPNYDVHQRKKISLLDRKIELISSTIIHTLKMESPQEVGDLKICQTINPLYIDNIRPYLKALSDLKADDAKCTIPPTVFENTYMNDRCRVKEFLDANKYYFLMLKNDYDINFERNDIAYGMSNLINISDANSNINAYKVQLDKPVEKDPLPMVIKYDMYGSDTDPSTFGVINEVIVGLVLNNLRSMNINNFAYNYGSFICAPPVDNELLTLCLNNTDSTVRVLSLTEYVSDINLREYVQRMGKNDPKYLQILIQIGNALSIASSNYGFKHGNLIPENIKIKNLSDIVTITAVSADKSISFVTDTIPVITNFYNSSINYRGHSFTSQSVEANADMDTLMSKLGWKSDRSGKWMEKLIRTLNEVRKPIRSRVQAQAQAPIEVEVAVEDVQQPEQEQVEIIEDLECTKHSSSVDLLNNIATIGCNVYYQMYNIIQENISNDMLKKQLKPILTNFIRKYNESRSEIEGKLKTLQRTFRRDQSETIKKTWKDYAKILIDVITLYTRSIETKDNRILDPLKEALKMYNANK